MASQDYYAALEVTKEATPEEIRKAYRRLAMKWHPDKNPDNLEEAERKFKEVGEAFQVLSDPNKKREYDMSRTSGGQAYFTPPPMNPNDIFAHFFGGMNPFFDQTNRGFSQHFSNPHIFGSMTPGRGRRVPLPISVVVEATLTDLYLGLEKKITFTRQILCYLCAGTGHKPGAGPTTCGVCQGRGNQIFVSQQGPFVQQIQRSCQSCQGQGVFLRQENVCEGCLGERTIAETKVLEVYLPPGTAFRDVFTFQGEGNTLSMDDPPGDVVVTVIPSAEDKSGWTRKGNDLYCRLQIPLVDALTGFRVWITHVSGCNVCIENPPGCILKPGDVKQIEFAGMPTKDDANVHGDLFVEFDIIFPDKLDPNQLNALAHILGKKETPPSPFTPPFPSGVNGKEEKSEQEGKPHCKY
uniref:J domain-containing protein n=1 Tax=Paramoeba aestuarina TaxID=180227 RepID=A0A7S4UMS2_9EUKA|mmetsp:Transcript_4033/g.6109  ORF Transcript_4033/g.6109 Transcript_4033/m.6109 type:complete len:409 (+) Transcript_4033:41-1267(+)